MKPVARLVVLCTVCCAAAVSAATPQSISCSAAAKPFFARAWDALANVRTDEARELFGQTVAVDPSCTLAWAHLGALTPGNVGRKVVEDAVAVSGQLPEAERLQVLALAAQHRGDDEQALSLFRSATVYAPRTWELFFAVGQRAALLQLWKEAHDAAQVATALAPAQGPAWNLLGYAAVGLDDHEGAVRAFRTYAEVAPTEPNAHDSLGDALLAAGRLDEAKEAFQRALAASEGTFWASHHGVATVCAVQRDWFCARTELEKARRAAPQQRDKLRLREWLAWSYQADQQPSEALRVVTELQQDAKRANLDAAYASAKLLEGRLLLAQGKPRAALTAFAALGGLKLKDLDAGERFDLETRRLHGLGEASARLGDLGGAERALAQLRTQFEARPRDTRGEDAISHVRGLVALQRNDPSQAINAFMHCSEAFDLCRLDLAKAQVAAGDPANAARTNALTRTMNHRDPVYWWVFTQAQPTQREPASVF